MVDADKITNDAISKGGTLCLLYFDLHSSDKDNLTSLSTGFIDSIIKTQGVIYALGEINEPVETDKVFSTSIEVKVLVKDLLTLINLCSLFNPLNVEILRPNHFELSVQTIQDILMSVSANWFGIKKTIAEKTSSTEDLERYKVYLENRIKVGRAILDKKDDK
ncbi:MAG: hypothetical protein AABX38_02525 [Candidatus Micrarchaeota archaeon]